MILAQAIGQGMSASNATTGEYIVLAFVVGLVVLAVVMVWKF